jgi:hypothetical protein
MGLLNICLGFGLAMHYGYGPPGLDGIFAAFGPMPPAARNPQSFLSGELGAPYDPSASASTATSNVNLPADTAGGSSDSAAEEKVLADVRDLASTAQTAMTGGQVGSRE